MGLIICLSTEALSSTKLNERISDLCEDVVACDGQLLLIPQGGRLIALLEILNSEGITYHFQRSGLNENCE